MIVGRRKRAPEPTALNFSRDEAGKLVNLETFLLSVIRPEIWTSAGEKKNSLGYLERKRDESSSGGRRHLPLNCRAN